MKLTEHLEQLTKEELLSLLLERSRRMNEVLNSIPGAVVWLRSAAGQGRGGEEGAEQASFSDGLCVLSGYSREELRALFRDRYETLFLPEDREAVRRSAGEPVGGGRPEAGELKCRLRRGDGRVIWVLDRWNSTRCGDGSWLCSHIILDVTDIERDREELRACLERNSIVMAQTDNIIFDWNLRDNTIFFSNNWEEKFGCPPPAPGEGELPIRSGLLHPEDRAAIVRLKQRAEEQGVLEEDMRLSCRNGQYLWCRVRATVQKDGRGEPVKVVGTILDIDREKRAKQKLQVLAERDALTGVYNRGAAQRLMEAAVAEAGEGKLCVLLVMDLDEFKQINDTLGHQGGDQLLAQFGGVLRQCFRQDDIIGRFGGDEFCVLMRGVAGREAAERKLEDVQETLRSMFRNHPMSGSCSIGAAMAPDDGRDFMTLFGRADMAMYLAKESGKNRSAFYRPENFIQRKREKKIENQSRGQPHRPVPEAGVGAQHFLPLRP